MPIFLFLLLPLESAWLSATVLECQEQGVVNDAPGLQKLDIHDNIGDQFGAFLLAELFEQVHLLAVHKVVVLAEFEDPVLALADLPALGVPLEVVDCNRLLVPGHEAGHEQKYIALAEPVLPGAHPVDPEHVHQAGAGVLLAVVP